MVARPQSLQDYLHDQLGWFDLDRRAAGDGRPDHLQPRRQRLSAEPAGRPARPRRRRRARLGAGRSRRWRSCRSSIRPASAARDLRECLLLQLTPGMPYYEQLKTLISNHLEDLEHNRLPVIERKTGYSIELIQEALGRAAQAEPQAGRRTSATASCPPSRPTCSSSWTTTAGTRCGSKTAARPSLFISPYYRKLLDERTGQRRDARVHQAEDQLGPVADRLDRAAPQHADPRGPGDRRSPDRVPRTRGPSPSSR